MIYDCFAFFNELDILEIRLHELEKVVDRFVLVEATRTHSNQTKPLYFKDNRARFAPWLDRITHIVADDLPGGEDAWKRENHQRNCIARGLTRCTDADTIVISDLDEIPNAAAIKRVEHMTILQQRLSYYFLNYATNEPWHGTRILPFSLLRQLPNVQAVREASTGHVITQAGWHFSYTGGIERIRQKIQSFAHQEFNKSEFLDPAHLRQAIESGSDPYNRPDQTFELADLATLPAWVVENRQRLAHLLWSDFPENLYCAEHSQVLASIFARTRNLIGATVEINPGSGQSTATLVNACYPDPLQVLGQWPADEKIGHALFLKNMRSLTLGNVHSHALSPGDYFAQHHSPVKFCHLAGSQSAESLKSTIEAVLPHLIPMGVICGRADAIPQDLLPGVQNIGGFWFWQRPWQSTISSQPHHALNPVNLPKNEPYFDWPREDVLNTIRAQGINATRAIELGCSSGLFGSKLRPALGLQHYTGIELDKTAAATARQRLDEVHVANLEEVTPADLGIPLGQADILVALDILEHLRNPWDVLARWVQALRPTGYVVTSIPNIQNISVILNLVQGRWMYESAGLLDITHMRFFTFEGIQQLMVGAGLKILRADSVLQPQLDHTTLRDTGNTFQIGNLALSNLSRQAMLQLFSYQYIVIAQKIADDQK